MKPSFALIFASTCLGIAVERTVQTGATFFVDDNYNGASWNKVAPSGACIRLDPSVLRKASSLRITGACCRMYTAEDCEPFGGSVATAWGDSSSFTNQWGSGINDHVVSYHCLLSASQSNNPYCTVNGLKRDATGEEELTFIDDEEESPAFANNTFALSRRVADPSGRIQFVAMGRNAKGRTLTSLVTVITTNSNIWHSLSSIQAVASAVAGNVANQVKEILGLYPSATYAYWSSALTGAGQTVYTIIVKYVWNGGYGIDYQDKLNVAKVLSGNYGFGAVAEGFIPPTQGVIAMRSEDGAGGIEIMAAVCPNPQSAAGAGINTDGTFVRYASTCDTPPSAFCLVQGEC